jgi:sulfur-oxidizing protein SoxA
MTNALKSAMAGVAIIALVSPAMAQDDAKLIVNGEIELVTRTEAPAHLEGALREIRSGWTFRTAETQALQMDDFENPGMIFVDQAIDAFSTVDGTEGKSCSSCHESVEAFSGLFAQMPKVVDGKVVVLEDFINGHRATAMGAEPWKWSGIEMQSMVALIALQSRGMPMNVKIDGEAAPFWEQGKEMYYTRYGQLELSCANCHEDNYDNYIRADHLSQGQINGFPAYRLKQATLISRHNRFRGCIRDTRGETFAEGSDEFKALELYVASRGNGLSVEGPSVRN